MMQGCKQQPLQQAQRQWRWQQRQQLLILQSSSGNLSFSSNTSLLMEDEEMSRAALSTFRAKEEEIERKKMEVCDCILSHLGRIKEETKGLATIHKIRNIKSPHEIGLLGGFFFSIERAAKMTVASIKLPRNKRQAVVKQMRHDIASRQDAAARVQVHLVLSL
ncbi:hypothetical protein ACJRO7_034260 [Eucalyptus globulus]|uniref:Uncharacterized protein n=1 Tax=Eucalyptus globulus TaxID=34317 RepID=A0ABD3J5R9_EUCGL